MSHRFSTPDSRLIAAAVAGLIAGGPAGCSKVTPETPTAVRVKQVEARQKTDPNFFLKDKSVATPVAPAGNAVAESNGNATAAKPAGVTAR